MKPAPFAWAAPTDLAGAAQALLGADATAMAGGQSLGPMLNLRAARPGLIVPLRTLDDLHGTEELPDSIRIGAATTHAAIADGRTPDLAVGAGPGILARIAGGIAYRAVRNRGTIGGSLCHADPAADWLTTLTALRAAVITTQRMVALERFVIGPFRTVLQPGEIVRAVQIPRPAAAARWGYHKLCRKPGEFAHAMAACLLGERLVIGATGGPPIVLDGPDAVVERARAALEFLPSASREIQIVAVRRAIAAAEGTA